MWPLSNIASFISASYYSLFGYNTVPVQEQRPEESHRQDVKTNLVTTKRFKRKRVITKNRYGALCEDYE